MTPSDRAALREAAQAVIDTQGHDPECHAYTRMMAGTHPAAVLAPLDECERMREALSFAHDTLAFGSIPAPGCDDARDRCDAIKMARAALGDGA